MNYIVFCFVQPTIIETPTKKSKSGVDVLAKCFNLNNVHVLASAADMKAKGMVAEDHLSSALLMVFLDSAKNLPRSKKSMAEPSPRARITIGNNVFKSVSKPKTTEPKWEENFQFLIHNPRQQDMLIELEDTSKDKKKLGTVNIKLETLIHSPDMTVHQPFRLSQSGPESKIVLRLCLRVLTSQLPEEWARDSVIETVDVPPAESSPQEDQPAGNGPGSVGQADSTSMDSDPVCNSDAPINQDNMSEGSSIIVPQAANVERAAAPGLRQRTHDTRLSSSGSDKPRLGTVQVTIRYSLQRSRLICVVHKCENLLACDEEGNSDPYVRLYLHPDHSGTKRKTQVVKNELNPIYDETFEWALNLQEAQTRTIDLSVKNSTGMFSRERSVIGEVEIDLSQIDLTRASTEWYELQPEKKD